MENKKRWNRRLGKIIIILLISLSALVSWIYSNIKEEKSILSLGYQETSKVTITSADNQYQYEVNSDDENTITITKYIGSEQEIEIPNTLDGYTVTSIGDYAFRYNTSLINIIIPNSVTSIETGAFYGCSVLKNITLPEYLTTIESYTFYNCTNLETIIIPDNVSNIKYSAFNGCSGLTSINLPDTITTIG